MGGNAVRTSPGRVLQLASIFCLSIGLMAAGVSIATAQDESRSATSDQSAQDIATVVLPLMDAKRGRALFATKGCVLCHSVNDVGGLLGPSLDAPERRQPIDVLDFAARMWRGSYAMIQFQAVEVGYQIELDGQELADLAAFAYDGEEQKTFSDDEIPAMIKDWIVKEPYSIEDDVLD